MKNQLIINADDFGLDNQCDEAILLLAQKNCISSTTILSNICSSESLRAIRDCGLSTGIHVNLIEGKPVSKAIDVFSLLDGEGNFKPAFHLFMDFISGKIKHEHIEKEITAQFNKLIDENILISHADSHQHIHQFPYLGNYILNVLKKLGCKKVRNCNLSEYMDIRMYIVKTFYNFVKKDTLLFVSPSTLIPSFSIKKNADMPIFISAIENAYKKHRTAEFMTHPSMVNTPGSYLNKKAEYEFWKSDAWKAYLEEQNIALISYNQL